MYILDVIPITKRIDHDALSYFSVRKVDVGTLVSIPLRKKNVTALVIAIYDATELRTQLRSSDFTLRNIHDIHQGAIIDSAYLQACVFTARYHITSVGSVCHRMIPQIVRDEYIDREHGSSSIDDTALHVDKQALQLAYPERLDHYETLIREHLSRHESVFFVFPTVQECEHFARTLSIQWQERTLVIHSKKTKKHTRQVIEKTLEKKPYIICGTPAWLCLPIYHLGRVVIESAGSDYYYTHTPPIIDQRILVEKFCERSHIPLIFSDTLLPSSVVTSIEQGTIHERLPLSFRLPENIHISTPVRNKSHSDAPVLTAPKNFSSILEETHTIITEGLVNSKKIYLHVSRTGYASHTICQDCGHTVACEQCSHPVVIHNDSSDGHRHYQCHRCNHRCNITNHCSVCNGHRFVLLGITTDRVAVDIGNHHCSSTVYCIDSHHAPSDAKAKKIFTEFLNDPTGILIGTEKVNAFLYDVIDIIIITSLGSMLAMPTYDAYEKTLYRIYDYANYAREHIVVQSMNDTPLIPLGHHSLKPYYDQDLTLRKELGYPPFALLVHIRLSMHNSDHQKQHYDRLFRHHFKDMVKATYVSIHTREHYHMNILLSVEVSRWKQYVDNFSSDPHHVVAQLYALRESHPTIEFSVNKMLTS